MRKLIISILLAGAAASPALAQDQGDHGNRDRHHEQQNDRQQVREQRQQARQQVQAQRSDRGQRPQFQGRQQQFVARQQQQQQQQVQANQQARYAGRQRADGVSRWTRNNVQQSGETSRWTRDPNQRAGETGRWNRDRSGWVGGTSDRQRQYDQQRQYRQSQVTQRSRWANNWNRSWRNDRRYDWRSYRNNHRSVFHLGLYIDPFNYGYRPFGIGYRLQPAYYGQNFWFDPGMYGLPYPPPGTQWIRYWNDALLVDVYSGEVVDVIQNFFW